MILPTMFFLLLALFNTPVYSSSLDQESIKITVNENFNALPGVRSSEAMLPGLASGFLHQGANFFFNPQLQYAPGYIPSHLEALASMINQHNISPLSGASNVEVEEKIEAKITEKLEPIAVPIAVSEIIKDCGEIVETPLSSPVEIIVEEKFEQVRPPAPVILQEEIIAIPAPAPAPVIIQEEIITIPEAPVLPPFSIADISFPIFEDVKVEEPVEVISPIVFEAPKPIIIQESVAFIPEIPHFEDFFFTNPSGDCIFTPEETLPSIVIPKPEQQITTVPIMTQFESFVPFVSSRKPILHKHSRKPVIALPSTSRLPIVSVPNNAFNFISLDNMQEKDLVSYTTGCAHEIIADRVVPNIVLKRISPHHS